MSRPSCGGSPAQRSSPEIRLPGGRSPAKARASVDLPEPGLSDHRELLAGEDVKGDVGEGGLLAAGVADVRSTAGDEGRHHDRLRPASTSVSASPTR